MQTICETHHSDLAQAQQWQRSIQDTWAHVKQISTARMEMANHQMEMATGIICHSQGDEYFLDAGVIYVTRLKWVHAFGELKQKAMQCVQQAQNQRDKIQPLLQKYGHHLDSVDWAFLSACHADTHCSAKNTEWFNHMTHAYSTLEKALDQTEKWWDNSDNALEKLTIQLTNNIENNKIE